MESTKSQRPKVLLVNRAIVKNKNGKILLLKRAKGDRWSAGKWELPGGKLDKGQDITHALEREVIEESGLLVLPVEKLAYAEGEFLTKGKYSGLAYVLLAGITKLVGGKMKLSEEHEDFAWVAPDKTFDYDLTQPSRKALAALRDKL